MIDFPGRPEVTIWNERDRLHIHVTKDNGETTIAEWWDDEARAMFDLGVFVSGPRLKESVLEYCRSMGLL